MKRKGIVRVGAGATALLVAAAFGSFVFDQPAQAQGQAPNYQVNPLWPQPLPNHWILGSVTGLAVDSQNHVWAVQRGEASLGGNERGMMATPPTSSVCCTAAAFIMEFDADGKLLSSFGGPGTGYTWPNQKPADIEVDRAGNVWITAAGLPAQPPPAAGRGGRGAPPAGRGGAAPAGRGGAPAPAAAPPVADAHVLKFSRDGKFLLQIGTPGKSDGPESRTTLDHPKGLAIDAAANEVYVADSGNRRIVVFDANTGAYKRHWGGFGEKTIGAQPAAYAPGGASARQFRDVTCVVIGADNMVYVCDRMSNRIQVFQKDGTYVKEAIIAPATLGVTVGVQDSWGSVWDLAFSNDAQQQFVFVADGHNKKVRILRRDTLAEVGTFGDGGRQPGRFFGVGSIAVDSTGNVYTGEDFEGKRVQKWIRR